MTAFSLKKTCLILTGLALLLVARTAAAQSCTNDIDCPTAACGGDICDWADTAHFMMCKAAGTHPKGMDGWCTHDSDCKCMGMGATCNTSFSCTFTRPCDAPGAAGCGAGGSGAGGSGGGGSGGGTTGTDGGGNTSGGGGGGGCSVAGSGASIGWPALALVIGLTAARRRRRR